MDISCDCGSFTATLTAFPNTPGRLVCYCRHCQSYLEKIDRTDVLDDFGGTEIIPAYPGEVKLTQGAEHLQCYRLTEKGLHRWATSCCNSPIANTRVGFPWVGIPHTAYTRKNPSALNALGDVRSRIFGRDAKAGSPHRISEKISFRDMLVVMPFILKGKMLKKHRNSPFFEADGETPVSIPKILS